MKNLKRLLGLMAISGFAFGFAATVNAAALDPAKTCKNDEAYVLDGNTVHCFTTLEGALTGVSTGKAADTTTEMNGSDIYLLKDATWNNRGSYPAFDFQVTINLNGHNINFSNTNQVGINVLADGNVTIVGTGKIDASKLSNNYITTPLVTVAKDGAFATMGNVTIDFGSASTFEKEIFNVNGGSLGISSDTVVKTAPAGAVVVAGADSLVALNGTWESVTGTGVDIQASATGSQVEVDGTWKNITTKGVNVAADKVKLSLNATMTTGEEVVLADGTIAEGTVTVLDGTYKTTGASSYAIHVNNNSAVALDIQKGSITAKGNNPVMIRKGTLTVGNATIVSEGSSPALYVDTNVESATIKGGTFTVKTNGNDAYALYLVGADTKYAINDGTFNSAKDTDKTQLPAIYFKSLSEDFVKEHAGMLTGGRYLDKIISEKVNVGTASYTSSEDVLAVLVKEGYQVTEDGNYKVITPVAGSTDTPGATDPENPPVADTFDAGIMSYVTLALSSLGTLGVAVKKVIR